MGARRRFSKRKRVVKRSILLVHHHLARCQRELAPDSRVSDFLFFQRPVRRPQCAFQSHGPCNRESKCLLGVDLDATPVLNAVSFEDLPQVDDEVQHVAALNPVANAAEKKRPVKNVLEA